MKEYEYLINLLYSMEQEMPVGERVKLYKKVGEHCCDKFKIYQYDLSIYDIGLPIRISNMLRRALGVETVRHLLDYTLADIRKIKGIGNRSIVEINACLKELDITLKKDR